MGSKPLASPGHPGFHLVAEVISALVFKWWTPVFWKNKKYVSWAQFGAISQNIRVLASKAVKDTSLCLSKHRTMATILLLSSFLEGKSWVTRESGKEKSLLRAVHAPLVSLSPTRQVHGVEDTILMENSLALWSLGEYLSLYPVITLKLGFQNSS